MAFDGILAIKSADYGPSAAALARGLLFANQRRNGNRQKRGQPEQQSLYRVAAFLVTVRRVVADYTTE
jgi:hypothetical protein